MDILIFFFCNKYNKLKTRHFTSYIFFEFQTYKPIIGYEYDKIHLP